MMPECQTRPLTTSIRECRMGCRNLKGGVKGGDSSRAVHIFCPESEIVTGVFSHCDHRLKRDHSANPELHSRSAVEMQYDISSQRRETIQRSRVLG